MGDGFRYQGTQILPIRVQYPESAAVADVPSEALKGSYVRNQFSQSLIATQVFNDHFTRFIGSGIIPSTSPVGIARFWSPVYEDALRLVAEVRYYGDYSANIVGKVQLAVDATADDGEAVYEGPVIELEAEGRDESADESGAVPIRFAVGYLSVADIASGVDLEAGVNIDVRFCVVDAEGIALAARPLAVSLWKEWT